MNDSMQNLNKLMDAKILLFKEILILTQKQKEDIQINEGDNIESLVSQKQTIMDKVDQIDKAFAMQFDILKKGLNIDNLANADTSRYPQLAQLKAKVQMIFDLAQDIMIIEKENNEKLNIIFNHIKGELKKINLGKKSLKAYESHPVNNDGIYVDRKK